jgi:GxxExxY protein
MPARLAPARAEGKLLAELSRTEQSKNMNHEPTRTTRTVLFENEVFLIQGAIYEVNREMGAGFLEAVYQECLAIEFATRAIPFVSLKPLELAYKGLRLRQTYVPDFMCFGQIIVEIKAVRELAPEHRAQTINYLRATGLRLALLVNFAPVGKARIERIIV